jgi:phosphatidylserine/phosphatidylglycerophosphate/cardiolipin synthase-like enzyme
MSRDVLDNRQKRLSATVRDLIHDGASSAKFAVGYLFLDGLVPLREQLEKLNQVEVLIGNVINRVSDEELREMVDAKVRGGENWVRDQEDVASTLRDVHDRSAAETAANLRRTIEALPRTPENQALILTLARRIADGGLKVRLYTHGRIHAKVSIIRYPSQHNAAPGVAIVGSSNMTMSAPGNPTELNVVVRDASSVLAVSSWFKNLWNVSQDFHRELFDELGQSWALQGG